MTDTAPLSDELMVWLSAYVDDVLGPEDRAEVEALAERDPRVADELRALLALNDDLRMAMDGLLDIPLPNAVIAAARPANPAPAADTLAAQPRPHPADTVANTNAPPRWRAIAAAVAVGAMLGAGGLWSFGLPSQPAPAVQVAAQRSWLGEVAEYHQIYARQTRHLVEVPASEKAHIETWLGKQIGVAFTVPDLAAAGWNFQGARLLVAAGKPVAQLMYTDSSGAVIALCALSNGAGTPAGIALRQFGDVHMATWKSDAGSFALVGDTPSALEPLAALAAPQV